MRHEGVLRSDGSGRPCSIKWLAAAKSAMELLPVGVPAREHPTNLRAALAGQSVGSWLQARGLDGRQTRQLYTWMGRLAAIRPEVAAFRVVVEWANASSASLAGTAYAPRTYSPCG